MTGKELKELLDEAKVSYPSNAKVAELEQLAIDNNLVEVEEEEVETDEEATETEEVETPEEEVAEDDTPEEEPEAEAEEETEEVEEEVEEAPEVEDTTPEKDTAYIYSGTGLVRTYSKEVHGKDYKKLAEQFAEKKGYKVVLK